MINRIDIAALVKRRGQKRTYVARPILVTRALEQQLAAIIMRVPKDWSFKWLPMILNAYKSALAPAMVRDAADDVLRSILSAAGDDQQRLILELTPDVEDWVVRVEKWQRTKFAASLKDAVGVDLFPFLSGDDIAAEIAAVVSRNVALIKGLNDDMNKQIEQMTWDGFVKQIPRDQLGAQLTERVGVGRSRANFIASDQTVKIASDLNKIRQTQAGIDQYKWRHSGKVHFRPVHKARDGKVFAWDDPPEGGHPGTEPNCGCTAQAYVEL